MVAMGRYGGFELSYGSDADVLFVHEPEPGADQQVASSYAQAVANELRRLLALPGPDPALEVDADLRPEGKQGPLVRTPGLLRRLLREVVEGLGGAGAAARRRRGRRPGAAAALRGADRPAALPRKPGISDDDVIEVRRIKARVDNERLPRGADPHTHLKLGRGGLADIEWTVQLLQMRHAGTVPGLRTSRTLEALAAARAAGLVDEDDAAILQQAGAGSAGSATRSRWSAASPRRAAARHPRARGGGLDPRLPDRVDRRDGQRPPALHAVGPGRGRPGVLGLGLRAAPSGSRPHGRCGRSDRRCGGCRACGAGCPRGPRPGGCPRATRCPRPTEQVLAAPDPGGGAHQHGEQVELGTGQRQLVVVAEDPATVHVEAQVAVVQHVVRLRPRLVVAEPEQVGRCGADGTSR